MAKRVTRAERAARGVLFVHSSPRAVCPHLEWAVGRAIDRAVNFDWVDQPVLRSTQRTEFHWQGKPGDGALIASALRGWEHVRFEVSEDPSPESDGARWMHTPDLGVFVSQTDSLGNLVVSEDRMKSALQRSADVNELRAELCALLGKQWDDELEPFRHASDAVSVTWLHQVG